MRKGIIFDLDGTLWDASENLAAAWNLVLREYPNIQKRMTGEQLRKLMGKLLNEIMAAFLPQAPEALRAELLRRIHQVEGDYIRQHGGVLFPHLEETLRTLSQAYPLYIVSNCQTGYIEAFFSCCGLGRYFEDYENPGRTGKIKWENIRLLMERNGLSRAVYIGDTQGDFEAAGKAGVPFIHAAYGFGAIDRPVAAIEQLSELPAAVTAFFVGRRPTLAPL